MRDGGVLVFDEEALRGCRTAVRVRVCPTTITGTGIGKKQEGGDAGCCKKQQEEGRLRKNRSATFITISTTIELAERLTRDERQTQPQTDRQDRTDSITDIRWRH
jgi:hypothetical protein